LVENRRFFMFLLSKSMPFDVQEHAFCRAKALLLQSKSIAFTMREHVFCGRKTCNWLSIMCLQALLI